VRIGPKYDGVLERVGAILNLVPLPVGYSMFAMPIARAIQVAQRTGLLQELVAGPARSGELSEQLGLKARQVADRLRRAIDLLGGERGPGQAELEGHEAEVERHAEASRRELDSIAPAGTDPLHEGP